jgi:hypothetical protein
MLLHPVSPDAVSLVRHRALDCISICVPIHIEGVDGFVVGVVGMCREYLVGPAQTLDFLNTQLVRTTDLL